MNSQYFSKEQIENGELNEFLDILLKLCYGKGDNFNDIHIKPEDFGAFVIEWEETPWSGEYGGHWQYINDDDDEVVMKWYYFPDKHGELFEAERDYKERLEEWLEEHKEEKRKQNQYGVWYSEKEQEDLHKYLEDEENGREEK